MDSSAAFAQQITVSLDSRHAPPVLCPTARPRSASSRTKRNVRASRTLPIASANLDTSTSISQRIASALAASLLAFSPVLNVICPEVRPAHAARGGGETFLSASGDVNKDGESLLRWSLPIKNDTVRNVQYSLESAINNTRGAKWGKVESDVRKAIGLLNNKSDAILASVPSERKDQARALISKISGEAPALTSAVNERKVDKFVAVDKDILREIGQLEELMVTGFPFKIPAEYSNLPRLLGRATVEVVVRKADGEQFDIDGALFKEGHLTVVVDGYSAPLSAGAFVDLASKGFFDNLPVIRSDGFIIQSGKPDSGEGYTLSDGSVRTVPLELFAKGDSEPLYGMTLEEDGRGAAATMLPFSSYGTLAMAREEFEPNSASSQYFWFLFEPDLTPAGRNLMDGSWAVFGYTVDGGQFLKGLQRGDEVISVKVTSGLENLKSGES